MAHEALKRRVYIGFGLPFALVLHSSIGLVLHVRPILYVRPILHVRPVLQVRPVLHGSPVKIKAANE